MKSTGSNHQHHSRCAAAGPKSSDPAAAFGPILGHVSPKNGDLPISHFYFDFFTQPRVSDCYANDEKLI